jgi:hypothetical protein
MSNSTFTVGQRVRYSTRFLRNVGFPQGRKMRGTVTEIAAVRGSAHQLVRLRWDGQDRISGALSCNLEHSNI